MEAAAVAEAVGGALMVPARDPPHRWGPCCGRVDCRARKRTAARGDSKLAASRGLVLAAGLAAMLAPGKP